MTFMKILGGDISTSVPQLNFRGGPSPPVPPAPKSPPLKLEQSRHVLCEFDVPSHTEIIPVRLLMRSHYDGPLFVLYAYVTTLH